MYLNGDLYKVEVKNKSSAMYVQPKQKLIRITNAHCYSVCPTCTKPIVTNTDFCLPFCLSVKRCEKQKATNNLYL